jgi:hypothetical protein
MSKRILQFALGLAVLATQGKTQTTVPDSVLRVTKTEGGAVQFRTGAAPILAIGMSDAQAKIIWTDVCTRPFQPGQDAMVVDRGGSIAVVVTASEIYGDRAAANGFSRHYDAVAAVWHKWLGAASSYSKESKTFVAQFETALANIPSPDKRTDVGNALFLIKSNVHDLGRQTVQDPREAIMLYLSHEASVFDGCADAAGRPK